MYSISNHYPMYTLHQLYHNINFIIKMIWVNIILVINIAFNFIVHKVIEQNC